MHYMEISANLPNHSYLLQQGECATPCGIQLLASPHLLLASPHLLPFLKVYNLMIHGFSFVGFKWRNRGV